MTNQAQLVRGSRWLSVLLAGLVTLTLVATATAAGKRKVVEITTPGGVNAWLVEERSIPLVSIRFAFAGGALQDPVGREGLGGLMAALLTEGAGNLNAENYARQLADQGTQISISATRDQIHGGFDALAKRLDASVELLRLALVAPRFDADAVERVRRQRLADIEISENEPRSVAFNRWYAESFPGHPYGRSTAGTLATLRAVTIDELKEQHRRLLARNVLRVVVVGDIDQSGASRLLDQIFAALPAQSKLQTVPKIEPIRLAKPVIVEKDLPLSTAAFGAPIVSSTDPAYPALQVLNQIIGSGDFDSTLMEEIRVKRGLAYAVSISLLSDQSASMMLGGMATKNENMAPAVAVLKDVLAGITSNGPTKAQFENAKRFLTGSYLLDFDSNEKLAASLLRIWLEGKRPEFVENRNAAIAKVTLDDVRSVARQALAWEKYNIVIVGRPTMPN